MSFKIKHGVNSTDGFWYLKCDEILFIETYLSCVVLLSFVWMPCSDSQKLLNELFSHDVITQRNPPVGIPGAE